MILQFRTLLYSAKKAGNFPCRSSPNITISQIAPEPVLFKQIPVISRLLRNNPDRIISPVANIFVWWMEKDIL